MIRSIILALVVLVLAASSAEAFTAKGSAEQVYVTGLAAGARATLVNGAGKNVATRTANPLGGMLFRNVKPGNGYRVKAADGTTSDALTVISDQPAPPSTDSYNLPRRDPEHGVRSELGQGARARRQALRARRR